jgi:hypothetical protein
MASSLMTGGSPGAPAMAGSGSALLGNLADQGTAETEEQRKKRLAAIQAAQTQAGGSALLGGGYTSALGG